MNDISRYRLFPILHTGWLLTSPLVLLLWIYSKQYGYKEVINMRVSRYYVTKPEQYQYKPDYLPIALILLFIVGTLVLEALVK